jgi:signal transduction histidine kinase
VTIADDGIGFDQKKTGFESNRHNGFGLFSVRERLVHLGGRFGITSEPGKGTCVTIEVPLAREKES